MSEHVTRKMILDKKDILRELGVVLNERDIRKLESCKNEIQLDNVAREMFMR